jgi:hypothetical protein
MRKVTARPAIPPAIPARIQGQPVEAGEAAAESDESMHEFGPFSPINTPDCGVSAEKRRKVNGGDSTPLIVGNE